jgi:polar amino acid transport system substrate-binding protein
MEKQVNLNSICAMVVWLCVALTAEPTLAVKSSTVAMPGRKIASADKKAEKTNVTLVSDPWCPFACEAGAKQEGLIVDLTKLILEEAGYSVSYKNLNWARAVSDTRKGKIEMLAGCAKVDAPDFIFPGEPFAKTEYIYIKNSKSDFVYTEGASLKGRKIGVINSYTYDDLTNSEVEKKNPAYVVVSGEQGLEQLINMLNAGRVDAIVESDLVWEQAIASSKLDRTKYAVAGKNKQTPQELFACLSPKNPNSKKIAEILETGMKDMRKSGKLKKLLDKYGAKDWK